ncbi:amidase [Oxynema aestuarii]|jgi:amidase|uniref:Amidase n=1 Tax=Oxynema aestuarii AP17 TaxID=2064643 RepID=A0A6H1TXB9_9CYAN|nr:amidase [Oxynema aestuarii]QIZ70413.1 amidase [Oxynema aestuarii AP17]
MNSTDLAFASALEQARLIRTGQISPLELTQVYLDRIDRLNPKLGSYFYINRDRAIADAKQKTEHLTTADPDRLPPFFGVPTAIKDLNNVAELPCSFGVAALRDQVSTYDDAVVARMKAAGFTILGKTATSQLGMFPYSEPPGFPAARNPWNLDYTPGGSSGGAAAAVAAGLCAIAQGSDGGGSIRGPAACCGAIGLKPSRGRVSYAPVGDALSGLATNGPIARTVADAAALLDVISGYLTGDPYWLPDSEPSFLTCATSNAVKPLRIGFTTAIPPMGEAAPPCQKAVLETVKHLETLGHPVEEVRPDFSELVEPFIAVWQTAATVGGIPEAALEPMNQWFARRANGVTAGQYLQAVGKMQVVARQIVSVLDPFDLFVTPVFLHPTIRVGEWADLSPEETLAKMVSWIAPCAPFNATGQPAIALPAGIDDGLPVGVQLVGRPAGESTLLAIAAQLEAEFPWGDRRPPLA